MIVTKDGNEYRGTIIENKINEYMRIELPGGSVFRLVYDDIDRLAVFDEPVNVMHLLQDNGGENPAGFLDFVKTYSGVLMSSKVRRFCICKFRNCRLSYFG